MKLKIVIGTLIIIGALLFLIIGGFKESAVYYLTVPELKAKENLSGQGIRVGGYVIPESIDWNASNIELRFSMTEEGDTLDVVYNQVMPDQLADAQQIVVEGTLENSNVLHANKIFLKCPSKYKAREQMAE